MSWIDTNDRRPKIDGLYWGEDSSGVRSWFTFKNYHWLSKTGHPVSKWFEEEIITQKEQIARWQKSKKWIISQIELEEKRLADEDAESHVWWMRFKEFINNL